MRPLGNTYHKNGFIYEIVKRAGLIAIAKQSKNLGGKPWAYEVIKIRECKAATFNGVEVPAHESAPGNEEWGSRGWTFPTIEDAEAKFAALLAAEAAKQVKLATVPQSA